MTVCSAAKQRAAAPEEGLRVFDQTDRKLYYVDFAGQSRAIATIEGGQCPITSAPNGDVYALPGPPYWVYRIEPSGNLEVVARDVSGDPFGLVVSPDGQWLYVAESGAIDRIPISGW